MRLRLTAASTWGIGLVALLSAGLWLARADLHRVVQTWPSVVPVAFVALVVCWALLVSSLWIESAALRRAWRRRTAHVADLPGLQPESVRRRLSRMFPDPLERLTRPFFATQRGRAMAGEWQEAGLGARPSRYLLLLAAAAIIGGLAGERIGGPVLSAALAIAAPILPWQWVARRAETGRRAFGEQLPHTLDVLAGGLAAGLSFQQAVEYAVAETPAPVSGALAKLARWMALGHSTEESLRHLLEAVPEESLALAIEGIELQRRVGGDLVSMLEGTADLLRERVELEREVRAVTAQGRLSGAVIAALVPVSAGILLSANPRYIDVLFDSLIGQLLLAFAVALQLAGWAVISRLMRVRY
jgi:tight adherence protein B